MMTTTWKLAALFGLCLSTTALAGDSGRSAETADAADKLIVHEWGTFTNFSGSNGIQLEFRPLVDNDLPPFVFNRVRQIANPFSKLGFLANQRMETPVTYFYTDRPREVEVRVDFPQGLLTEFYPPVRGFGPPVRLGKKPALEKSHLDWGRVRVVPANMFQDEHVNKEGKTYYTRPPIVEGDNHYAYARETDSAMLEATDRWGRKYYEKFLFYRGVGNFSLPLTLEARGDGEFQVSNSGTDPIESLFLVRIDGGRLRFSYAPRVEASSQLTMRESKLDASPEELAEAVVEALLRTGLYEKEARSMVKTWRSSWFGEEGTRLLYLVPGRLTEEILPLKVSPQPDELVRVLVGRMEVMTPEDSQRLAASIRELGTCVTFEAAPLSTELKRFGRFAEPALEYLRRTDEGTTLGPQIGGLLAELRQ